MRVRWSISTRSAVPSGSFRTTRMAWSLESLSSASASSGKNAGAGQRKRTRSPPGVSEQEVVELCAWPEGCCCGGSCWPGDDCARLVATPKTNTIRASAASVILPIRPAFGAFFLVGWGRPIAPGEKTSESAPYLTDKQVSILNWTFRPFLVFPLADFLANPVVDSCWQFRSLRLHFARHWFCCKSRARPRNLYHGFYV